MLITKKPKPNSVTLKSVCFDSLVSVLPISIHSEFDDTEIVDDIEVIEGISDG